MKILHQYIDKKRDTPLSTISLYKRKQTKETPVNNSRKTSKQTTMGRRCCISGCLSTSRLPEHHGVTYHSFPVDENTRSIWIKNSRISLDRNITKSVLVCSRHFRRADFQPQRSGKYLLKQKVFPTVFPWGKIEPNQIEEDMEYLNNAASNGASAPTNLLSTTASSVDEDTKATVAATVAQIMAQTAELNAQAALKAEKSSEAGDDAATTAESGQSSPVGVKFEPVTTFNPSARLEAQDFEGTWHLARIVEVDNDDREVLIKFEKTGKNKLPIVGTEEWIPMNSTRLRQKVSAKPINNFDVEDKCLARWSGPRKFPGTVKKILPNDTYEILFDDGYIKNVRAIHMNKISFTDAEATAEQPGPAEDNDENASPVKAASTPVTAVTPLLSPGVKRPASGTPSGTGKKKRGGSSARKDWPLLDLSKIDLSSLDLPVVPKDGEWACHWVNDQPIGHEGFLLVGEHRKPTVIVEDWRLPSGWVKHMYQRSNVLGKWDVILVSPSGKRFRSKADLKVFLEEQGQVYNPDVYDFSIHRRRAKDINCYVYTPGYVPQQPVKPKSSLGLDSSMENSETPPPLVTGTLSSAVASISYMETPTVEPLPPIELLTSSKLSAVEDKSVTQVEAEVPKQLLEAAEASSTPTPTSTPTIGLKDEILIKTELEVEVKTEPGSKIDVSYALIGGLKVQIIDNLFRCPDENCSKNFRKENHLQIHVKHYHRDLAKLLGACPKMLDLAEKRTHPIDNDSIEPVPKNQIPNQQFFAKLHQQDLEQTKAHRRNVGGQKTQTEIKSEPTEVQIKQEISEQSAAATINAANTSIASIASIIDSSIALKAANVSMVAASEPTSLPDEPPLSKKSRFSPLKRPSGSRKSNRQRTTKKYLTAAQATAGVVTPQAPAPAPALPTPLETSFSGATDFEETRHSFNATPEIANKDTKKRKSNVPPPAATPLSSAESPITADSGSSSLQPLSTAEIDSATQYIKENGELIKIVRMRQEEIINCLCGYIEEDGLMIQCELCLCWQHGICNGINKESQVPEKYVCYICRNPIRGRESLKFKHDQDWLYEGKLPTANYHTQSPTLSTKRAEFLKQSHTLTGNLLEIKNYMHSLKVKINIANNKCHPKLYLWAKKWDEDIEIKNEVKNENDPNMMSPNKKIKTEIDLKPQPNIPQPEAPIDPVECQQRLQEHIRIQQNLVMQRLNEIEASIDVLDQEDDLPDLHDADLGATKDALAAFIKELDTMKKIAKLNALEHAKQAAANKNATATV